MRGGRTAQPSARFGAIPPIPFRAINRWDQAGFRPGLQRHHLLPRQLLGQNCFGTMFDSLGRPEIGFDDFRANGLLLHCQEQSAIRLGLPLHRGPHRNYNEVVLARVGQIESQWSSERCAHPETARANALFRLALLQRALRKRLLNQRRRFVLNRKDPLGKGFDFAELDAMAEILWQAH